MRLLLILTLLWNSFAAFQSACDKSNVCPAAAGTTFTFVNDGSCYAATTSCAVTYSPTNGNLVVADIECRDSTASQNPTITTDNGSSTWTNGITGGQQSGSYYNNEDYTLSAAGSPTTITGHCGAASVHTMVTVTEYHRTSGSWVLGGVTTHTFGTSTTATSNSVTPTSSVPALIHGYFMNSGATTPVFTTANSTVRVNQAASDGSYLIGSGDQIVSSASGSYTASANLSTSEPWQCWASWFK